MLPVEKRSRAASPRTTSVLRSSAAGALSVSVLGSTAGASVMNLGGLDLNHRLEAAPHSGGNEDTDGLGQRYMSELRRNYRGWSPSRQGGVVAAHAALVMIAE